MNAPGKSSPQALGLPEDCPGLESSPPSGQQEEGAPAWTTTFGDLMSLLLTFFILLYSMSELKMERFLLASESLSQALSGAALEAPQDPTGAVPGRDGPESPEAEAPGITAQEEEALSETEAILEEIARRLREFIEGNRLEQVLSVEESGEGVHLRISTALFPPGSAVMDPDSRWIVTYLGEITASLNARAVVSGHTDDTPIGTAQFPSNWELSAARAAGVARELAANGHAVDLLRVESWGEHRPIADNATPEGRAQNRRVELLFSRADVLASAREALAPAGPSSR